MTYKIKPCGGCYTVYDGNRWAATFANSSDAEAYAASKPLPEPTKHRCVGKISGCKYVFAVFPQEQVYVIGDGLMGEITFRKLYDILPECDHD